MALICAISNEVPMEPVVSPASGSIFEKRLIQKYIAENGTDPINGEKLLEEDLIEIKTTPMAKPRALNLTSIPQILKMLQDEWDACMLESFTLRQQLQTARQELSHALYQHDAACRVIARLNKDVTASREALATLKPHAVVQPAPAAVEQITQIKEGVDANMDATEAEIEPGITEDVVRKLQEKSQVLTAARKQRGKTVPDGLVKAEEIKEYKQVDSTIGLHSASLPGVTAIDVQLSDANMIVTGGNDKSVVVYNRAQEKIVATFKGHQKRISDVVYHPFEPLVVSGSHDNTVRVWSIEEDKIRSVLRPHTLPVTAVSLHATGDYVLSVSLDEKWAFSDIRAGRVLCRVQDEASSHPMTCGQFHPDGLIFGVGTRDSMVKIWDLKEQTNVANFPGHTGQVQAISFSENGYYLATAAEDSTIKLWDLRKLKNFKTINLPDKDDKKYQVSDLCFDQSGSYLAVAGNDVRVYLCKQWQELCIFGDHSLAGATGVRFGGNAEFVVSAGLDRSIRFYSTPNTSQMEED